jgi:hypothetical protein
LGEKTSIIKKNTEALLDASMEAGLEANAGEKKYVFVARHRTTGQNQDMVANKTFKNVAKLRYRVIEKSRNPFLTHVIFVNKETTLK